ncbi:hypothetical protein [Enterobacter sp. 22466]|uniref:InvB/SpaK family type III secretion system chaperone n=1 Tax=Enterobacter sp. 22466 TaxID=3453924 RepID=UPI003F86F4D4
MQYDLSNLLIQALDQMGISDVVQGGLDNHSTITLTMKEGNPDINLAAIDDEVWVWAKLTDFNENALAHNSSALLPLLLQHDEDCFHIGQPALYEVEGDLELRAQVKEKSLESVDAFMTMLDSYFNQLLEYKNVLV